MDPLFATDLKAILAKIDQVDPIQYGKTRNYIDGAVTCLSPYISRGVISTRQILLIMLKKGYQIQQIESFVKELCWRDYFQRVGQHKDLKTDIKHRQEPILNHGISSALLNAKTGIQAIDNAINQLYQTGYMHNHCRMYTASLVCNIAKSHWHQPAQWMYYHLLDGDWASNACSWQWVAGANSNKKYYANQENINRYAHTNQVNTFLDISYEVLEHLETPASLLHTLEFLTETELPADSTIAVDTALPTFIYNYYNLDPLWHADEPGNRVLLIEPDFFIQYPVSKNCINFMLALSKNIPGIQVYTGSCKSFTENHKAANIFYKEHPLNTGYIGTEEPRDWIDETNTGYYPSFFSYWKKVEKQLYKLTAQHDHI
jgi:deoxyribodipyrimidine photo-lyase